MSDVTRVEVRPPATSVEEIVELYARWGHQNYDEELSQSSHASQVAAWALAEEADDALVVAALLHDVGHLLVMEATASTEAVMESDLRHEALGARYLTALFPPAVTGPIALHVQAKRYRCAVYPGEIERLSEGSQASLVRQGGPLSDEEVVRFARLPSSAEALKLRAWDDAGKSLDVEPAPIEAHLERLHRVASA